MQSVRTVIWVLLLVALGLFSYANWNPVSVRIWDNLLVDTMLPAIVVVSFLIGFLPMWLYHRGSRWQASRRIAALEHATRTAVNTPVQAKAETPAPAPSAVEEPADPALSSEPEKGPPHPGAPMA